MKELMILAKIRNVNGYQNMSIHLENIFTTTCSLKPTIKPASRPKQHIPTTGSTPVSRLKNPTPAPQPQD